MHTLSRNLLGCSAVLSGADVCIKSTEFDTVRGVWCAKHRDCVREVQMLHERARVVLPAVNASICYGLSSASISDQVGIEKTHVKVQYNEAKEDKPTIGFGNASPGYKTDPTA